MQPGRGNSRGKGTASHERFAEAWLPLSPLESRKFSTFPTSSIDVDSHLRGYFQGELHLDKTFIM